MDKFFRKASDLNSNNNSSSNSNYLKQAGNLNDVNNVKINKRRVTIDDVKKYLLSVVSGKKFDYECELGTLCGAGQTIVSFSELQKMVSEGYNIVNAKCITSDMIMVEFQEYKKNNSNKFRR